MPLTTDKERKEKEKKRDFEYAKRECARKWIGSFFYGFDRIIHTRELVDDGRKAKRVVRQLLESGYVTAANPKEKLKATNKAYRELDSKPLHIMDHLEEGDPLVCVKVQDHYRMQGILLDKLSLEQKKHVIENTPNHYRLLLRRAWSDKQPEEIHPGDFISKASYNDTLLVITDEWLEKANHKYIQDRTDAALSQNLRWVLAESGLIHEHEADLVREGFTEGRFSETTTPWEDWETSLRDATERLEKEIARKSARLRLYNRIRESAAAQGGLSAVAACMRPRVQKVIEKKMNEDEE